MSWEEDLQMALCIVKVLALVVIAMSLYNMSNASRGYLCSSPVGVVANNPGSSSYLGPGYGAEFSQSAQGCFRGAGPEWWASPFNMDDNDNTELKYRQGISNQVDDFNDGVVPTWNVLAGKAAPFSNYGYMRNSQLGVPVLPQSNRGYLHSVPEGLPSPYGNR
jgi:hypothetical protein